MPGTREPENPLDRLDPAARRASPRVRLGIGGAVVLLIASVGIAAWVSADASGGGAQGLVGSAADAGGAAHAGAAADAGTTPDSGVAADPPGAAAASLLVHVTGAVASPGIVELAPEARVVDAIAAAGGLAGDADSEAVNLARTVADGEQLRVPRIGEAPPPAEPGGTTAGGAASGGPIDLNHADVAALDTLPRIGPALAQRIVDWREQNGPFTSIEQLREVSGIGDAVLAGLDGLVRV